MGEPPQLPSDQAPGKPASFFQRAATFALLSPLLGLLILLLAGTALKDSPAVVVLHWLAIAITGAGVLCGVVSLFGIGRHGIGGILVKAMIGIALAVPIAGSGLFLQVVLKKRFRHAAGAGQVESYELARRNHVTRLTRKTRIGEPAPEPPPKLFRLEKYETKLGPMDSYVGVDPGDGRKHPAIIWKFGGFSNSIGETAWTPGDPDNDQSASPFREAGIVMMYPSVRGGNLNPGYVECGYGEVDDLIAAAKHLKQLPYVDPNRVYLGGHSTGGTVVLLVAALASEEFRAVFSLGPVSNPAFYPEEYLTFDPKDEMEAMMRAPIYWLHEISTPTFVFEGDEDGNAWDLHAMAKINRGKARFFPIADQDHFSIIRPLTRFLASKILGDTGSELKISLNDVKQAAF